MKVRLTVEECKGIQLDILKSIDQFCREKQIRYSLGYGSLIGAIRHGGYIPWDDDIDLIMPRPDYDRFLSEYASEQNEVLDMETSGLCVETFAKVCRKGTLMVDRELKRSLWGVNVDIFPIDGAPADGFHAHYDSLERIRTRIFRLCPHFKTVGKQRMAWFVKYFLKRIIFPYPGTFVSLKKKAGEIMRSIDFETAPLAGAFYGDAGEKEFMDQTVFRSYTEIQFDYLTVSTVARFDEYLTALFGDYMQLPPEKDRVSRHLYDSYMLL